MFTTGLHTAGRPVQIFWLKSISCQRAPITSPVRAAVKIKVRARALFSIRLSNAAGHGEMHGFG